MGLRINTNVQSVVAQNSLKKSVTKQSASLAKLSTGSRINKAADDAAGLAISEKLRANIRGTKQAARNANDGISLVQTAEGGLNEVTNILIRLRELSVQAASDTIGDEERSFSNLEFQQLTNEIERISNSTKFNGRDLINGTGDKLEFQIGNLNNAEFDRISFNPADSSAKLSDIGIEGAGVATKTDAQENLDNIDTAIGRINSNRASLGAIQNRLQSTISNLEIQNENLSAANSRIRDTDVAAESAELAKANILNAAGTSVLAQANNSQQSALKLIG